MISITSPHNPRFKQALKLRTRRGRQQQGRFLVDGLREVQRFLQSGFPASELFLCPDWLNEQDVQQLSENASQLHMSVYELPASLFAKLAYGDRADGVVAAGLQVGQELENLPLSKTPLIGIVESIEKPGNLGAIMRTCDAVGADGLVHVGEGTDWYHPNAIRASTGALFSIPCVESNAADVLAWARQQGLRIYAARPDADRLYTEGDYRGPCAIVLGSEAKGLSSDWQAPDIMPIRLPMRGVADSLNVSVTSAVLLFEALRQRSLDATHGQC